MSEADKMFEKLGYEKDFLITYTLLINRCQLEICFNSFYKTYQIKKFGYDCNGNYYSKVIDIANISSEIALAINKKCEELGWI